MRLLFSLIALLSVCVLLCHPIYAAEACSGDINCGEHHSNCSGALISPLRTGCKLGLACHKGHCINAEDLAGQSCSEDIHCLSNIFALKCLSNTCKFFGFAGPGESCNEDSECYVPKGSRSNVKCTDGKCQSGKLNDPCFISDPRSCLPGLYCDTKAALCKERLSEGAGCDSEDQCEENLICFGDYGRDPQCQAQLKVLHQGEPCSHALRTCKSELFCVQGVCRSYESQGLSCNQTSHKDASCDYGLSACQCNALTQSLQCEVNPSASPYCTEHMQKLKQCMTKNQCTIEFEYDHFIEAPPNSCINQHCRTQLSQFYRCRSQVLFPTDGWDDKIYECGGWFFETPAYSIRGAVNMGVILTLFVFLVCTLCAAGVSQLKKKNEYGLVSQFESQPMVDSDQEDELSDDENVFGKL